MILGVQTNIPGQISVWLLDRRGSLLGEKHLTIGPGESDRLLAVIDRVLSRAKITVRSITTFVVVRGPGPFTPVRTGIVISNTLAMIRNVPVVGLVRKKTCTPADVFHAVARSKQKTFTAVRPWYGREPNISRPSPARARTIRRHAGQGRARIAVK